MLYFETKNNITLNKGDLSYSVTFKQINKDKVNIIRHYPGSYKVDTVSTAKAQKVREKLQLEKFKADEYLIAI